jgi:hypothetical protein
MRRWSAEREKFMEDDLQEDRRTGGKIDLIP